jgi:hypothetical protein
MLSDLWLMSAATFRRLGKIEQAKGAIQEAEVRDEGNPNVWVQVRESLSNRFIYVTSLCSWDYITSRWDIVNMQLMHCIKL